MQLKEEALFTLKYDGKPVINELGELEKKLQDVKEAQKSVERGTKEWAENKAEIKQLEAQIKLVREEMGVSGMTVRQLEGYYRQLNREIKDLTPGTEAYIQKAQQITEVNTALSTHRQTVRGVNEEVEKQPSLWDKAKAGVMVFFAAFGAMELLQQAFSFIQGGIQKALALSDMMGGVAKATGQSTDEVKALSEELDKIDTRTQKEDLMTIAQIGGQLGVANEQLLGFIQSTDMATVALGDEFSGGAEEAADKLGGLKKLFAQTDELTYGDAINRIGSAINELGADGSATGPVIAEFTARMGQLGDLSPQITQTMGLGAAFQELGLSAEISAGGLSNILLTAAKDTATFAQQLGVSEAEMKNFINTNPNEFLLRLAESLKNVPADQLATRLDDLGIKSQESTKVMSLLKDQTDLVRQKQELANNAFQDGTSLQKEFTTMNSTAAAEYEKSQKALALIATEIGQGLLPAITTGTRGIITFVNILREIPDFISENRTSFAALGVAVISFNGSLIAATASSIAHAAAEKARLVWTQSATAAQWLLNTAMTANPIAMVVTAVALLVAGFTALYNNSTTVRGIISGLWEMMKTGVSIVSDLTDKCLAWLQRALEPLRPALETLGRGLGIVWDIIKQGVGFVADLHQAFVNFIGNGLNRISTALEPVRSALSSFWGLIDTGITKIKNIGSAIASFLHVDELVSKVRSVASQIGDAFNKGYGDKLAEDRPKQVAAHQQTLNTKKAAEQKHANELTDIVTSSEQKALDKKAAQNEKHRQAEAKKAADAAKKEADEAARASAEGLKKVEQMRIAAIKDDQAREKANLQFKHNEELANIEKSKASQQVKAVWIKALNDQLQRDISKVDDDHRKKKEKDDAEAAKRTLDLKIKLAGDEKADKLQKLEDVAAAQRAQVQKDVNDETQKAQLLKQIHDNLTRDKERVDQEFRRKKQQEENALQDALYQATVADANARLQLAGNNAQAIYDAKKARLDAEYQYNKQKLEREAAEEKQKNQELIQDKDRRAQADKATDDRLKAQLKANDQQYENEKTQLTQERTEARRQNQQQYYQAIKALMDGDFTTFTDILNKKLLGEKKQLTESQQKQIDTIDAVGEYTVMAVQALQKLNQMKLDKELANIKKEKDSQLAAWKEKYDKGLIGKDEYEKGVDKINKEADAKIKAQQLQAFKRQQALDITMAIINGAQAALKSLATLGWPLGLIGVAAAAVTTGIQIALIKRQQPPAMARGGYVRNAGVPEGPNHGRNYGESGISLVRRDTGEEVGEMEGREPIMVLSQNTYRNNKQVVDSLLHSSLHRNGAPIMLHGGIFGSDGGSYGDYLPKKFKKGGMFQQGGWMDNINEEYEEGGYSDSSGGSGGSSGGGDTGSDVGSTDLGSADAINSVTNEEIQKSQALMEAIGKNTEATVLALDKLIYTVADIQRQMKYESDTQQSTTATQFTNLRSSISQGFTSLNLANAIHTLSLKTAITTGLTSLQGTMKMEFPSLGKELVDELTGLRLALALHFMSLKTSIGKDVSDLQESNKTSLTELQKTLHDDLLKLQNGQKTDLTNLQKGIHQDLDAFQKSVHRDMADWQDSSHDDLNDLENMLALALANLQKGVHTDLESMKLATSIQLLGLRTQTHTDFTDLTNAFNLALATLQKNTHKDLSTLQESNKTEMRTVQQILNATKAEQGYQSGLLNRIADKNLTVSVQNVINVNNQINVVAEKSDFR